MNSNSETAQTFEEILKEVQQTKKMVKTSPRTALEFLGVSRRGWRVIEKVNALLNKYEVITDPDFESAWIYGEMKIIPKPTIASTRPLKKTDPTPRLSLLKAANINLIKDKNNEGGLISVNRETSLEEAITIMILNDFSQLPILSGTRNVEGVISWRSIGRALALGKDCLKVNDCKDEVVILNLDEPLFSAVKFILEKEVVLVKQKDATICGIVTATDIGEQFISLAEPFLIIEQIENHIRKLLDGRFSIDDLKNCTDPNDKDRTISSLSDLNFGEYLRIIENPEQFEKLSLKIDRPTMVKQLENVRKIRNDVMHFDPDGITPDGLVILRQTANFFYVLATTNK